MDIAYAVHRASVIFTLTSKGEGMGFFHWVFVPLSPPDLPSLLVYKTYRVNKLLLKINSGIFEIIIISKDLLYFRRDSKANVLYKSWEDSCKRFTCCRKSTQ